MKEVLENEKFRLVVETLGAEIKSLVKKERSQEYMWSGDPAYWSGVSPLLFPFIGSLRDGCYTWKGKQYQMEKHGFARHKEFSVVLRERDRLVLEISDSPDTLRSYPFAFRLEVEYILTDSGVRENWRVHDTGGEGLYFSIGGHPALACPPCLPGEQSAGRASCSIRLLGAEECSQVHSLGVIPGGLLSSSTVPVELTEGKIAITEDLFSIDTILLQEQITGAALCDSQGNEYIRVESGAPVWGIWSMEDSGAAYICLEPWFGLCDYASFRGALEERPFTNHVEPGGVWEAGFEIKAAD